MQTHAVWDAWRRLGIDGSFNGAIPSPVPQEVPAGNWMEAHYTLPSHHLSIVIPLYNEKATVAPLLARVHEALQDYVHPWEVLLVDNGSTDGTDRRASDEAARYGSYLRVIPLQRNFGQTAALQAGVDLARGDVIVTLDGDLENDPVDIPRLVQRLLDEDLDVVVGWRRPRHDDERCTVPPGFAQRLIGRVSGVVLHDYGCGLRAYRASVIKGVRLHGELHRFIPAWVALHTQPGRIKEEVVRHHPPRHGRSKHGRGRTLRVLLDLIAVYFYTRLRARPGRFLAAVGLVSGALGAVVLGYFAGLKLILGEEIGPQPLLIAGMLLVVVAVQFLTAGVLSGLLSRIYLDSGAKSYIIRHSGAPTLVGEGDWKAAASAAPAAEERAWS
jgi:glycosyltransferase involved in cell wall biosynthesis